jgi:hypothetical protein
MPLAVLLAAGALLRVALSVVQTPAMVNQYDSASYLYAARGSVWDNLFQPPGYPFLVRAAHDVSDHLGVLISLQHALGLLTAFVAWWVPRWITGSPWLGLVPAAFICLDADALLLEHTLMSETLFRFLVVAAVALAVVGLYSERRAWLWLAAAGAVVGLAVWVRLVGVILVLVLVAFALVGAGSTWRRRLAGAAAAGATAAVLIAALLVAQGRATGDYGLGRTSGWATYARVAKFADCRQFDVPRGAEPLCERTAQAQRRIPDWYAWHHESPARRLFTRPPAGNDVLGRFGRRAIVSMPRQYAKVVAQDVLRYFFVPEWTNRNTSLIGPRSLSFRLRTPDASCPDCRAPHSGLEVANAVAWSTYFEPFTPRYRRGIGFFQGYQRVARVHGLLLLALVLVAASGALTLRGRAARAHWLYLATGVALLVFPVMTTTYNVRYAIPAVPLIATAAALSLPGLLAAVAGLRRRSRRYPVVVRTS